ncbi:MAG TPA: alpha/beta hydrolase [Kofleriaceae bacterium]|nr:alpha/beta hydrolase [Kofleriaceae bacterium]
MSRRVSAPSPEPDYSSAAAPPDPAPRTYRETFVRRLRSAAAGAFFESLATVGRLHPAASPKRNGVEVERDVMYGPHGEHNRLDIYRPVHRPGPWPMVLYVHGGAFHLLSKDTHWLMGLVFARFGYLVVNISYRLAPKHPYPAAIADTCAAYRWMLDHARALGGDPTRVVVAGESAGGNLVTSLALATCTPRPEPWARAVYDTGVVPRAAMPFCAILQVSDAERFGRRKKLAFWVDGMLRDAGASYLHGLPRSPSPATELADPLLLVERAQQQPFARPLPPFFAPVGTRDPLLDDTRRLEKALAALGVPCEARYYPGGIHAFHALVWDPVARRCWRDALAFLDRHVR